MNISAASNSYTTGSYLTSGKTAKASASSSSTGSSSTDTSSTKTSSSATADSTKTTTGATSSGAGIGKEDFLKLFTTQLKYQNPMSPMDTENFTTQLAQFTSVEQLTNLNTNIETLSAYSNSLNNISATSLIGKSVIMNDSTTGTVTGVTFDSGVSYLKLDNGSNVKMSDVKEIKDTSIKTSA
ncbi:MAG: hypothetical protein HQL01_08280 [Nitrospirae bacterium]|nr:hypothetical protein [Nitrospirota bacterium]